MKRDLHCSTFWVQNINFDLTPGKNGQLNTYYISTLQLALIIQMQVAVLRCRHVQRDRVCSSYSVGFACRLVY